MFPLTRQAFPPPPPQTNGRFTAPTLDAAAGAGADPPQGGQPDSAGGHRPPEETQDGLPRSRGEGGEGGIHVLDVFLRYNKGKVEAWELWRELSTCVYP